MQITFKETYRNTSHHRKVKGQKETTMRNIPSRSHCMLNKANTKRCVSRKDVRYIIRAEIDGKNRLVVVEGAIRYRVES